MKLIKPTIFNSSVVSAFFTEANRSMTFSDDQISGIDFGLKTTTDTEIIKKNYQRLFKEIGLERESIALANQIHGSNTRIIEKPGIYEKTDGLVTKTPGLPLGIQVADCAAILVADEQNHVIGAFHAGWRGAVSNIMSIGLEKMESVGGKKDNFKAYISPCISAEMFEVGEEVAEKFPKKFVIRSGYRKPHVDLKGLLTDQMTEAGMSEDNIEISMECTMQNERFFSYRRERERAGRMLGMTILNEN